jgi:acyl-coenzyme A synthetase/AMP-(fatty) acid ligase
MTAGLLASLLFDGNAESSVASRDGHSIGLARFRADVAAATARLAVISCRRGLVVCDDAYWAMVGMFALAHAGAETVFPPNALPSTITMLSGAYDHVLTDGAISDGSVLLGPASSGVASAIAPMNAEMACVSLFTSGSSGPPKRVVKTIRQLELEAAVVESLLGSTVPKTARIHATVVHQHLYGLTFRLCWPLATRRPFFANAHQFWEPLLSAVQAGDVLVTTPSHLSRLGGLQLLPAERHLAAVLSGGAPLPDDAAKAAHALFGCPVREFVGSTEAGVVGSRVRVGDQLTSWQPLPGISVMRRDDGRMHVRSPFIFDADNEVSDDLIELDDTGGFRLLGRADRIAKIEGVRISLAEFDARLAKLPGVAQAAVVVLGGDTPYLGGVVVLDAEGEREIAAVGAFRLGRRLRHELSTNFAAAALPRRWRFVRQLPVGALGKVSAPDLAGLFDSADVETPLAPSKVEPDVLAFRPMADGVELDLRIPTDLASLAGHFPGLPIVPGVCLIDWAVRFAVRHVGFRQNGTPRLQVKFRRILQPDCEVKLTIRRLSDRRISFDYRRLDTVYSSGTISDDDA